MNNLKKNQIDPEMRSVLSIVGVAPSKINDELVQTFTSHLFDKETITPAINDEELNDILLYLDQIIIIQEISTVAQLHAYFKKVKTDLRRTIREYRKADITTRIGMEEKVRSIDCIEPRPILKGSGSFRAMRILQ